MSGLIADRIAASVAKRITAPVAQKLAAPRAKPAARPSVPPIADAGRRSCREISMQPVHRNFGLRAHVHFAVRDRRHRELHRRAGGIAAI